METQTVLFNNSNQMPEGLYIELMNKLKIDFNDNTKPKREVIVIHKSVAKTIAMTKIELQQAIIKGSIGWLDREEILLNLPTRKYDYVALKDLCHRRGLPFMKLNPRWVANEALIAQSNVSREELRHSFSSPGFFHL